MTEDVHRRFGVDLNNSVWEGLDALRPGPSDPLAERERFLYSAYASAYHWMETPTATAANRARAEHLIARAAVAAGFPEIGLGHANRCLDLCETNLSEVEDWDLAFAHEAMARAAAAVGDEVLAREHFKIAEERGRAVEEEGDRNVFLDELKRGPWFGFAG